MKDLVTYIKESINEAKETVVRIALGGDDKADMQSKFVSLAEKAGLYAEKTDDGIKVKVKPGSKVDSLVSELESCIEKCKSEDEDKHADCIKSCESSIEKLKSAAEEETSSEDDNDEGEAE